MSAAIASANNECMMSGRLSTRSRDPIGTLMSPTVRVAKYSRFSGVLCIIQYYVLYMYNTQRIMVPGIPVWPVIGYYLLAYVLYIYYCSYSDSYSNTGIISGEFALVTIRAPAL